MTADLVHPAPGQFFLPGLESHVWHDLKDESTSLTARLYAVHHLGALTLADPARISLPLIQFLKRLLLSTRFAHQRQSLFYFREVAHTLTQFIRISENQSMARSARTALLDILAQTNGRAHQAASEALSALPFDIKSPAFTPPTANGAPMVSWQRLTKGLKGHLAVPRFVGRSLIAPIEGSDQLVVAKLARADDDPQDLLNEVSWMTHLRETQYTYQYPFHIPQPLAIGSHQLFKLTRLPIGPASSMALHRQRYAVAFVTCRGYYTYPNDDRKQFRPAPDEAIRMLEGSAWLLGYLSGLGIVHSALIPLFHNRVQQGRRRDQGLYEWYRAGRLDRWLDSCRHPNLGPTGLRDFEHLDAVSGANRFYYRLLGNHLLSLFLICGSYFRNHNRQLSGHDHAGQPVDARRLFDQSIFKTMVLRIFRTYYRGFVGHPFEGSLPLNLDRLVERMIEEMGVDRHMEEMLRVADQERMSPDQFQRFLLERGIPANQINTFSKGATDIALLTGPHLGGFNQTISLPEMIEAIRTMTALCVVGRYWHHHRPPDSARN